MNFLLRIKRLALILLVNVSLLALGIFLLEAAFGKWRETGPLGFLNLPRNVSRWLDPSWVYRSDKNEIFYRRDSFGFRGRYHDPGQIDILTVGGSTTAQTFIGEGETWQDVLSGKLDKSGKKVSVVNAGVDGQSTRGHLQSFELWFNHVPNLKPK